MYAELKQMPHSSNEKRRLYVASRKEHFAHYEFVRGLRRHYGITVEQYNEMFNRQAGCCAMCGTHQSKFKNRLHVDHDHETKQIRSLLCTKCNPLIGYADESIDRLQQAIDYLIKFKK
jgi:Recombination endonuclease VII